MRQQGTDAATDLALMNMHHERSQGKGVARNPTRHTLLASAEKRVTINVHSPGGTVTLLTMMGLVVAREVDLRPFQRQATT